MAKKPPPSDEPYLEHAVWLFEWHERRSEILATRSVGLLGFNGILLAFVLQLVTGARFDPGTITYAVLAVAMVSLIGSAAYALSTMMTQQIEAPGVSQLREWWAKQLRGDGPERPTRSIIERYLVGTSLTQQSPIDLAAAAGSVRALRFRRSMQCLFVGVASLASLVVDIVVRTRLGA